ncbi:FAD-dependent oxidoreductase [Hydrogenophaga sp.]|uniref:FAD-dependent oxidoreductase n=1 Tax=Hydrogenophaga sp. TaxID=1904254 RepID=UPI0027269C43|nr:FAD-dependent oxidoreductase [Hydrogenophaga sp.]MDO9437900.1 FAD-binding protein [Hydrogenophaga sp.]
MQDLIEAPSLQFDLVTIGGGFAGLVSAVRAAELGMRVAVLERGTGAHYPCNSRIATGAFVVMGKKISLPPAELFKAIMERTDRTADPALASLIAHHARRARLWLQSHGAKFINVAAFKGDAILAPPRRIRAGVDWQGRGSDALLGHLEASLNRLGGRLIRGAEVRCIVAEDGRCSGVVAQIAGAHVHVRTRAVVVADGGFQASTEMIREHITTMPDKVLVRAYPTSTGDGIRMAAAIGAHIGGFGQFYGHLQHRSAMTNAELWPYPQLDALAEAGVLVGANGLRFADEGLGGVCMANAVARSADPLGTTIVLDNDSWAGEAGCALPVPANAALSSRGIAPLSAPSIPALAELAGIDASALASTIAEHNQALAIGDFGKLWPRRSVGTSGLSSTVHDRRTEGPQPILKAPFHALPICAGITQTMGGIRINARAQALRPDGTPVDGLYVSGSPVFGLDGGARAGYVGGFAKAFVLGLVSAESAAADHNPAQRHEKLSNASAH